MPATKSRAKQAAGKSQDTAEEVAKATVEDDQSISGLESAGEQDSEIQAVTETTEPTEIAETNDAELAADEADESVDAVSDDVPAAEVAAEPESTDAEVAVAEAVAVEDRVTEGEAAAEPVATRARTAAKKARTVRVRKATKGSEDEPAVSANGSRSDVVAQDAVAEGSIGAEPVATPMDAEVEADQAAVATPPDESGAQFSEAEAIADAVAAGAVPGVEPAIVDAGSRRNGTAPAETLVPVKVIVEDDDEPTTTFADLGLSDPLLRALKDVGYEAPTPIQIATIPVMLSGRDIVAQAQTGSGKTAAFGLPIIELIDPRDRRVQAIILCPTRELAIQVAEALHKYGKHKNVETLPIYGGQPYERQFRGLQRGVQIVVGTPGRVMDHMRRGSLSLDATKFFVLDEADEMLDMGFIDDVDWILGQVPGERQAALFSATMPPRIADLSRSHLNNPERISVRGKEMTVPTTTQSAYEVPRSRKVDALTRILDAEEPQSTMIFCRTKHGVDELGEALLARGYSVETLHGDLSQAQRDRVMRRFRGAQADVLIATDVAARGLDIPEVSHVINYDVPESGEAYVHRIGRTGRAGRSGQAITIVTARETRWLRQIERLTKAKIDLRRLPTLSDVADRRREAMKDVVAEALKNEEGYSRYLSVIEELSDDHDSVAVAAAILKLYADETGRATPTDLKEDDLATFTSAQGGRSEAGMTRLSLSIGRAQGVRPQDIVGAIANEANIPGRSIGAIDILDTNTYVDVPSDAAERVVAAMSATRIKGKNVTAEVSTEAARSGRDRGGRPERGGDRGFDRDRGSNRGGGGSGGYRDRPDRRGPGSRPGFRGDRDEQPRQFDRDGDRGDRFGDAPSRDRPPLDRDRDDRPRRFDRDGGAPSERGQGDRFDGPRQDGSPRFDREGRNDRFSRPDRGDRGDRPASPRPARGGQPYRPFHRDNAGANDGDN